MDAKNTKIFSTTVIDGIFTHRPYAKDLVLVMLENGPMKDMDFAKLARECLKNLTGEDLFHLYQFDSDSLWEYEKKYQNINGNSFEHEMAKIMLRYRNEGKPDASSESKKQVRF